MAVAKLFVLGAGSVLPAGLPPVTVAGWTRTHES